MKSVLLQFWESKESSFRFLLMCEIYVYFHVRKRKQQRLKAAGTGGREVDDRVRLWKSGIGEKDLEPS